MAARILRLTLALAASLLIGARGAHAADGVIEINAASAAAGGITPGDGAGLPITLSLSGSYRLTDNLSTADPNQDVIHISADHVTLDLGGHTISGPTSCAAFPCTNEGSGRAVASVTPDPQGNPTIDDVRVANGVVRGMGGFGIELVGSACQLDGLHVSDCGGNGIQASCTGQVLRTISRRNGDLGIHLLTGIVADSQAIGNASSGIYISGSALVLRNASLSNGRGVFTDGDSSLIGNTLLNNTVGGLSVTTNSGYGQNTISGNGTPQTLGGVQLGGNVCNAGSC